MSHTIGGKLVRFEYVLLSLSLFVSFPFALFMKWRLALSASLAVLCVGFVIMAFVNMNDREERMMDAGFKYLAWAFVCMAGAYYSFMSMF